MPCSNEHGINFLRKALTAAVPKPIFYPPTKKIQNKTRSSPFQLFKTFFNAVAQPFAQAIICFYRQLFAFFCNFMLHLLPQ